MKKGSVRKGLSRLPRRSASLTPSPTSPVISSTRSPSPLSQHTSPSANTNREQKHQQLDITAENVEDDLDCKFQKDGDHVSPGVKYITEPLIKSLSKQENLTYISSLNLSSPKDGEKKFKYIENLEKCCNLKTLNLSNNQIEKIEKLDKLMKLRELDLSCNKISKIEGIEHMQKLQKLNLAGNEIEHIPVWVGKKLRSLRILNLKQNQVSSLCDIVKLKPLQDLTSLFLADNPVVSLPHYRLYTIFHLRALENLDGQPVTNHDRQEALERFNLEEIEKLERELENTVKEMENLKLNQSKVLEQLRHQDEVNKSLKEKSLQQKRSYEDLQGSLDTTTELLKQKTMELTRACQKQYELEQELAFYKIDAKFEPLNYIVSEDVELDNVPGESPYVGKARYKRNMFIREGYIAHEAQEMEIGKMQLDRGDFCRKPQMKLQLQTPDELLDSKEKEINSAQRRLEELQCAISISEQQVLEVTGELQQLEDALAQKKVCKANKERLEQQLSKKVEILQQLHKEALELEKEIEKQKIKIEESQKELEDVEKSLASINPKDAAHAHMKAQKLSKEQQFTIMNDHCKQLENRLDEMLSRIAKETEEIKDLEQQLTDGQIATNEALKRDLESIITGLQEYLESIKCQAKRANDECRELQKDKESLLQRLANLEEERNSLERVAMDVENMRKEMAMLEGALQEQREINESLRDAQGNISAYEAELEAQLRDRDIEAHQHKEELERLKQLSQMELSALQAELEKERQALENALTRAQLAEEKEQQNSKLLSQFKQLQGDNNLLKQQLKDLQNQLEHLIHPEEVLTRINELRQKLQAGVGEIQCQNSADVLEKSLANLQKEFNDILADAQREKKKALARQAQLQEEVISQQEKLEEVQEKYTQVCIKTKKARVKAENRQNKNKVHQLENKIQSLCEKIKNMEEIQGLANQQLQEAHEEKETVLAQLDDLVKKKEIEDARTQLQFASLNKEVKELKRTVITSDKLATTELLIAKNELKGLHGTVLRINRERAEEAEEAKDICATAANAAQDLARAEAEIELLQQLLKEKEEQFEHEMEKAGEKTVASSSQKLVIEKLHEAVEQQQAELNRLKWLLDNIRAGNKDEISNLQDEIAALRNVLSYQNDYITSVVDPLKSRGYWYYMPSSQVSTPASHSTKDSGICLPCSGTCPHGGRCYQDRQCRKEGLPHQGGCWVYSPLRNTLNKPNSGKDRRAKEDSEGNEKTHVPEEPPFVPPPGTVLYTALPDGAPVPQGTVVYGPPPAAPSGDSVAPGSVICGPPPVGAQVVYGPLPPNFTVPLIPVGVLHCNVPEHHDLESKVSRLEDTVCYLKSRKYKEKMSEAAKHKYKKEVEKLHKTIEELVHERQELEREGAELRQAAQKQKKRKDFIEGCTDNFPAEMQVEKCLKHHEDIVGEIECIEKTLLKRRAELREADRLLSEAEVELQSTRGKTKETFQKYNHAKQHLSHAETEAKELERKAQEMATELVKASQQFRLLQADTRDLEQRKREQEGNLKKINKMIAARDSEFKSLNQNIELLTESLQKLQGDIKVAESNEKHHLQILREAESLLQGKKTELETLKDQITTQQQELLLLEQQLNHRKEELHVLQECISQKKVYLQEALQEGETEANEKLHQIRELKQLLEELNAENKKLDVQINEKRAQLSLIKKDIAKEEENLQGILGQISKHKIDLKYVLEMLELENNEHQSLKLQHDQKVNELEKIQHAVLEEKLKLENIQKLFQCQKGEVAWQEQVLENHRQENERLLSQMHTLENNIESLTEEKAKLKEVCQGLEKKLSQTRRDLTTAAESSRTVMSNVEKMESDVKKLQEEVDVLNKQKKSLHGDIIVTEKDLQGKKEELETLKGELNGSRQQLQQVEQDLKNTTRHRDELLREQAALKETIREHLRKRKDCQESLKKREKQLQELQKEIEEKETELAKQEVVLHRLKQNSEHEGKKLEECTAKVKEQKILLENELTNQEKKLEQTIAKVRLAEENLRKLEKGESRCAALEETVRKTKDELSEKESQLQLKNSKIKSLQKELETSKSELNCLQDQIAMERKKAEKHILSLKEAMKMQKVQLERVLQEQTHENHCLKSEQTARSKHKRARHLWKDHTQAQQDYMGLQPQVINQDDMEKGQRKMENAAVLLKQEVEDEIPMKFSSSSPPAPEPLEDLEASPEVWGSLQCRLGNSEETGQLAADRRPLASEEKLNFSQVFLRDEKWRGEALRENLQHHEDQLKAWLQQCLSKKAEVLLRGKQQRESTLHSLKQQVDALDDLISITSSYPPFLARSSSLTSLHDALSLSRTQV
ncbi:CNTRL protein, partial [Galbula dea]|nr:CNTRL protein [Galbula dea]